MKTAKEVTFLKGDEYVGDAYRQVVDILNNEGIESFINHIETRYPDKDWDTLHIIFE